MVLFKIPGKKIISHFLGAVVKDYDQDRHTDLSVTYRQRDLFVLMVPEG